MTSSHTNYKLFFAMNERPKDIIYSIRTLNKYLSQDFDNRLSEYGLTGHMGRILFFINGRTNIDNVEVIQADIEKEFQLSKSTVSGMVCRLEKRELIIKEKKSNCAILKPSEKGVEIIKHIKEQRVETLNALFKGFSEEEIKSITERVNKILDNLKEGMR